MTTSILHAEGGCTCGSVRYRLQRDPMIVHCCHCRWCQRETGSAFVLNALVERECVDLLQGEVVAVPTPSASGRGQTIVRCPRCQVALWSHYPDAGAPICFVRVGTLDFPERCPPDIHIYTASRQPWVRLPPEVPAVDEYYELEDVWSADSLARFAATR